MLPKGVSQLKEECPTHVLTIVNQYSYASVTILICSAVLGEVSIDSKRKRMTMAAAVAPILLCLPK